MIAFAIALLVQSSTTTCQTILGITTCNSRAMAGQTTAPIDYSSKTVQPDFTPLRAFSRGPRTPKPPKIYKKVGKLLAAGRCDEAQSMALKEGEFDLATRVQSACERSNPK